MFALLYSLFVLNFIICLCSSELILERFFDNGNGSHSNTIQNENLTEVRNGGIESEFVDKGSELEHRLEAEFIETPTGELRPSGLHILDKDELRAENLDHHHYQKKVFKPRTKEKRNFNVGIVDSLWPRGIIPYTITQSETSTRNLIQKSIDEFNKYTCVQWIPRTSESNYVAFEEGDGCGSWVGIIGGRQAITLQEPNCVNYETILHEMCHAIGQVHEQSRHDRYPYIRTNWENIPVPWAYNFDMVHTLDQNPYDQNSILQYSLFSFSTDNQKKSMYLTDAKLDFLTEQKRNLSFYDIKDITDTYHCIKDCTNPPSCENGGYVNFQCQCVCPVGLKGTTCTEIDGNCGEIADMTVGTPYVIKSSNYPSRYNIGDKCVWVLKAALGVKIKATITDMDIAYNHDLTRCYHWIEVQYNLIGQPGILKCGELQAGQTLDYETTNNEEYNLMMFKFNSQFVTNRNTTRGFYMILEAYTAGCHNRPCKSGGTCVEGPGDGSFTCLCLPGYSGSTCTVVKATSTVDCDFETDTMGKCFMDSDNTADLEWTMMSMFDFAGRTIYPQTGHIMAVLSIYKLSYYGDVGRLSTNLDFEATERCLQLDYQITVFQDDRNFYLDISYSGRDVNKTVILYQTIDTANAWKNVLLDIPSVEGLKITIEAAVGDREVMIDNLLLTPGACDGPCATSRPCKNDGICVPNGASYKCECPTGFTGDDCSETGPLTLYTCSFETNTTCFLSQSGEDNLDWTVSSKETDSSETGPSLAAEGIYFSYLDTSTAIPYETAVYKTSYVFPSSDRCLMFYYHMYGLSVSSLSVKTKGDNVPETVTWIKYYSQGNRWHQAGIDIPAVNGLQVSIEATSGIGPMGDIALDNVVLRPGLCLCDSNPCLFGGTCTAVSITTYQCRCAAGFTGTHCEIIDNPVLTCSFENTYCSFLEQDHANDTTDWILHKGYTWSPLTGPNNAAAGTYYLYLEATENAGKNARMQSLQLSGTKHCLRFFYHMYGSNMGSLNVITDDDQGETTQWTRSGNQGATWHQAEVDLDLSVPTKVIIEGVIGSGSWSDISLDLISIFPLECDKDAPFCNHNPCLNAGVCTDTDLSFTCSCPSGYTGNRCQLQVINGNWGQWESGACSVTCGGEGQQSRNRSCDNPAPANSGASCTGASTEIIQCNEGACPTNGNWGAWTDGSCSVSCGTGQQTRSRVCDNPAPVNGGLSCPGYATEIVECNEGSCPINGNWGAWIDGSCSVTCGTGQQTKSRVCDNPAPSNGGLTCPGSDSEIVECNEGACQINGNWGAWTDGSCSVTCGTGQRTKSRVCDNPAPSNGGLTCPGSASEIVECNEGACPINGNWGAWTDGSCSVTCGTGQQTKSRVCDNPAPSNGGLTCPGSASEIVECNEGACPINGNWGAWTDGSCSVTCGTGQRTKSRVCDNPAPSNGGLTCPGSASEIVECNEGACPINGNWGAWTDGSCSVTCGTGQQTKSRVCDNPAPSNGGLTCPGSATEIVECNEGACPINGNWGAWTDGSCSVTCGTGQQSKSRVCDNPAPSNGGLTCPGSATEIVECNEGACPINGNWGAWTDGSCSVTCGTGQQTKSRVCDNPAPSNGGLTCPGSASEIVECNEGACPINGNWGAWTDGSCSVTCGTGQQTKNRVCDNPAPSNGGLTCPGSATEIVECNEGACPINGNWGAWTDGSCSVSCGTGQQTKSRICDNPAPANGGLTCPGSATEIVECNEGACPINGNWGAWTDGSCSVTCGTGQQTKSRVCDNPAPANGGQLCVGQAYETIDCQIGTCRINGNWGAWIQESCSVTCGGIGRMKISRVCNNPLPTNGGAPCFGPANYVLDCPTLPCAIDGNWGSWSDFGTCSVSCGGGIQSRSKSCDNPSPQNGGADCVGASTETQTCNSDKCPVIYRCTFEAVEDKTCFMADERNPSRDVFDWTTQTGPTVLSGTGPPSAASGYYYKYIDTLRYRVPGHNARLINTISLTDATTCLIFSYHMYGPQIGTLRVLTINNYNGETRELWRKSGNQGNVWRQAKVQIVTQPVLQISIDAIVGGIRGNIAIDNLEFQPNKCPPCASEPCQNGGICSETGDSYTCSCPAGLDGPQCQYNDAFRLCTAEWPDPLCFLANSPNDNLDWTNHIWGTRTRGTGPPWAMVGYYYTYLECSGKPVGSYARLVNSIQFSEKTRCLSFWYHMYGAQIGTLRVISSSPSNVETEIWRTSGNKGYQWLYQSVTVPTHPNSRIIIEGTVGGDRGDIALDQISLLPYDCSLLK